MGLYDRDYAQDQSTYRPSHASSMTMVTRVIVFTVIVYLIDNFTNHWLNNNLALATLRTSESLRAQSGFWPWQFISYGFLHSRMEKDMMHIVLNMWALFIFGSGVEERYGGKEFLAIYLSIITLSGAFWFGLQTAFGNAIPLIGASGGVAGMVVLFALNFPHRKMRLIPIPFVVPAFLIGVFFVAGDVIRGLLRATGQLESNVAFSVHLAGAALGFAYFKSGIRLTSPGKWSWNFKMPKFNKPKLRIHDPEKRYADLDRQADRLLDKVHREGQDSLTAKERKILDDYSRRMRQRRK